MYTAYIYIYSGYTALLQGFILIVGAKNEKGSDIFKILMFCFTFVVFIAIFLYLFGISNSGIARRNAISLGFTTPNVCAGIIQTIWFLFISLYGINAFKSIRGNLFILFMVLCFVFIKSRASIVLMILSVFLIPLMKKFLNSKHNRVLRIALYLLVPLLTMLTYLSAKYYTSFTFLQQANMLFGSRIFMNYYNLQKYGISMFGQSFSYNGELMYNTVTHMYSTFNTLDGAYICLIIEMGLVGTIIWIVAHTLLIRRCLQENYYGLLVSAILIMFYGLTESSVVSIFISFPLLFIFSKSDNYRNSKVNR